MKRIIQLLEFIFIVSCLYSQTPQLKMKIISLNSHKKSIELCVEVDNLSSQEIAIYYQNIDQICSSLMSIKFIDTKNNQIHLVFPCTSIPDLNHIDLTDKNSLIIGAKNKVSINYSFNKKNLAPYLKKKRRYKVIVGWYFKDVFIKTDFKNYFNGDVESDSILFKNE
jgi:hypothetical protein